MMDSTQENFALGQGNVSTFPPEDHHEEEEESSTEFQYFVAVLSVAAAAFICFGNVVTLLSILKNSFLQTTPNLCIGSLAMADVLVGVAIFVQGVARFQLSENFVEHYEYLCLTLMSMLFVSVAASLLSTVVVALDRFVYIIYSIQYSSLVTKARSFTIIAFVWLFSLVYGSIPMYTSHYQRSQGCQPTHAFAKTYMIIVHPTLFFTVCVVNLGLYIQVTRAALRQRRLIRAQIDSISSEDKTRVSRRSWKLVKLLMTVFGFFFISWCPLLIVSILEYTVHVSHEALTVCGLVAAMNSGVNFLVLLVMNKEFRNSFRKILCSRCMPLKVQPFEPPTMSGSLPD